MARYIADQNKVALLHESGTYSVASGAAGVGIWIGEVTEHTINDVENKLENKYLGTATRSYDSFELGPRDVTGTLTYNTQDMRLPFFAIGSTVDGTSGPNVQHWTTQVNTNLRQSAFTSGTLNPPISFTLEDSKQSVGTGRNFVRTIKGVVPNTSTITATQGEKIVVAVDYVGQTLVASSGTTTTITQDTKKPYLWDSSSITVNGSVLQTAKEISLEINQNVEAPHYLNGSRDISVPFMGNREYTMNVTMDLEGTEADALYNDLYKLGSQFNITWDLNQDSAVTGSQHTIFVLSGCNITSFDNPSTVEGLTESTMEIRPKDISAIEHTSSASAFEFNAY